MFMYMVIVMFVGEPVGTLIPDMFATPEPCIEIAKTVEAVSTKAHPAYGLCVAVKTPKADKVAWRP